MSECVVRIPKHRIEEMRKIGCGGCPFKFQNCLLKEDVDDTCPILAVLPEKHGELIDRQAVYEKIKWWQENTHDTVTKAMLHEFYLMLFGVPAIVPAERSEDS